VALRSVCMKGGCLAAEGDQQKWMLSSSKYRAGAVLAQGGSPRHPGSTQATLHAALLAGCAACMLQCARVYVCFSSRKHVGSCAPRALHAQGA